VWGGAGITNTARTIGGDDDVFDAAGMEAALLDVWQRHKLQCDERALFDRGCFGGGMMYVPVAAGKEAEAIVRKFYTGACCEIQRRAAVALSTRSEDVLGF
jgi:hypothetical protein